MKRIDAEPVLIFVASEETFEQIIESILPEQRDQIIDCPTYTPDRTIAHRHCYGQTSTMEEIIPPASNESGRFSARCPGRSSKPLRTSYS